MKYGLIIKKGEIKDMETEKNQTKEIKEKAVDVPLLLVECGPNFYRLSKRVDESKWSKISKYFTFYYGDSGKSEDCMVEMFNVEGWATRTWNVKKVEEILDIPLEQTVEYRDNESKKLEKEWREEKVKEKAKEKKIFEDIDKQFENAKKPDPGVDQSGFIITKLRDYKLIEVEGIKILDTRDPASALSESGKLWIIQKKWIWKIEYTHYDGYGNNVLSEGFARGIGVRISYTKKLASMIIKLKDREQATNEDIKIIEEIYGPDFEKIWSDY